MADEERTTDVTEPPAGPDVPHLPTGGDEPSPPPPAGPPPDDLPSTSSPPADSASGPAPPAGPPPAAPMLTHRDFPGGAPWGWKQSVIGLVLALAPVLLLSLVAYLAPQNGGSSGSAVPTVGIAVATVILTLVFDSWYLIAAWLVSLRRTGLGLAGWGFRRPAASIFWRVPVALVAVYAVSVLYGALVETKQQAVTQDFPHSSVGLFLFFVLACMVAPIFEESFFRGFLFRGFASSWGIPAGAVVSAIVFALSHQQLDIFVPLFALGLALAWVYSTTRSVWGSITLHAVYNLIAIIAWIAS